MKDHSSFSIAHCAVFAIRLALLLFLPFLLTLTGCTKRDGIPSHATHHYMEIYFVPTHIETSLEEGKEDSYCTINLCHTTCIDNKNSEEFRKIAAEYGEMGDTTLRIFTLPYTKPYNIQGIKLLQLRAGEWVDVSDKVEIGYYDISQYILGRYNKSLLRDNYVRKKITGLTEFDLKWLPKRMILYFKKFGRVGVVVMDMTIKDRPTIRTRLY